MNFTDVYELMQPDFAARLASLEFFGDIMVAAPRVWKEGEKIQTPKSITERVDQALTGLLPTNGKIGAAVRVFQPTVNVDDPNGRKAKLMMVTRCEVHPIFNNGNTGTQKKVSLIGYEVMRAGLGFSPLSGFCSLYCDGQSFLPYVSDDRKFETVDILLQANFSISQLDACKLPGFAVDGAGLVTLINVTAEAEIWYTTDLSFPAPQIVTAKKYTGPFTVDAGTQLRWAAYMPDNSLAGSHAGFQTIKY